jgi:hypothetical protein
MPPTQTTNLKLDKPALIDPAAIGVINANFDAIDAAVQQIALNPRHARFGAVWDGVADDTTAVQAALDALPADGGTVLLPPGSAGFTTLRLPSNATLRGAGPNATFLKRLGAGSGGPAIAMKPGHPATRMTLDGFRLFGNGVGPTLNGIELGTEAPGTTDFALYSSLRNLVVTGCTGTGIVVYANAAYASNCWAQANLVGWDVRGTSMGLYGCAAENNTEEELILAAAASDVFGFHTETSAANAAKDVVSVTGARNTVRGLYSNRSVVRRYLVNLGAGAVSTQIEKVTYVGGGALTALVNDAVLGTAVAVTANLSLPYYSNTVDPEYVRGIVFNGGATVGGTLLNDYREETFTATLTGCTTSPTGTVRAVRIGKTVTLYIPAIEATSNTTAATLTLPAAWYNNNWRPARIQICPVRVKDNSVEAFGTLAVSATGDVLTLGVGASGAAFTAAGTKGVGTTTVTFGLT